MLATDHENFISAERDNLLSFRSAPVGFLYGLQFDHEDRDDSFFETSRYSSKCMV
jgi:hypothetical protein